MTELLAQLKKRPDLQLALATIEGFEDSHFEQDGVEYFVLKRSLLRAIQGRLGSGKAGLPSKAQVLKCAAIVKQWNPDVVHVHGTEAGYGLIKAWKLTDKPIAVSVQGLMRPCSSKAYGDLLPKDVDRLLSRLTGLGPSCLQSWRSFRERIPMEESILRSADIALGRTEWDRAWVWAISPHTSYRFVDDLMRSEFLDAAPWSPSSCRPHRILCTTGPQPMKGLHVLLEAIWRLRQVHPDVQLHVASAGFGPVSSGYSRCIWRLIRDWGLEKAVTFLGWIDAGRMVEEMRLAHCYVTPSFNENGCNALQEAMLVGLPSVSTLVGGMLSVIESERTGLTFPAGDAALLAWKIRRIFEDDTLAMTLGTQARLVARDKHDPERVVAQVLQAYEELTNATVTESLVS